MPQFKTGLPSKDDYEKLFKSEHFINLEKFSESFLHSHKDALTDYNKKWVSDPFHQWSRQWEYPFALERLLPLFFSPSRRVRVLDAGSGVTFFPFYLKSLNPKSAEIHCCDFDGSLNATFEQINEAEPNKVLFKKADLHNLPYESNSFDGIYCISVLEHTKIYREIIQEFKRILKSQGSLVLTFDISITGAEDISVEQADELLEELKKHFQAKNEAISIRQQLITMDYFTTFDARKLNPSLLPWKSSLASKLKSLVKKNKRNEVPLLTFYCADFVKRE